MLIAARGFASLAPVGPEGPVPGSIRQLDKSERVHPGAACKRPLLANPAGGLANTSRTDSFAACTRILRQAEPPARRPRRLRGRSGRAGQAALEYQCVDRIPPRSVELVLASHPPNVRVDLESGSATKCRLIAASVADLGIVAGTVDCHELEIFIARTVRPGCRARKPPFGQSPTDCICEGARIQFCSDSDRSSALQRFLADNGAGWPATAATRPAAPVLMRCAGWSNACRIGIGAGNGLRARRHTMASCDRGFDGCLAVRETHDLRRQLDELPPYAPNWSNTTMRRNERSASDLDPEMLRA